MSIYTLQAYHNKFDHIHYFTEHFSTIENLEQYLKNHPYIVKIEITEFELNPK